ncbi:MAG: restriction endonuclease subunit S [Planctomycetota bacterium]|nr:MAG: restriction endonuclease subunit S [Planctomycetota bacterium]REK28039.1 MAG: restriction endonuclease subunit S [Planctomycetota bacterium]REK37566.1 MAG: restriction endonuclease subunit S [Planctomycetota bacterium]
MQSEKHLGDYFQKRSEKGKPGLPLFSVTMNNGLVHRDTLDRKTDTNLADEEHLLIKKGDIAYNMMRMWQGASGLAEQDGIVSPAYVVVAPNSGIDPLFASYWFKSPRMIYLFWAYSYGLTNDRLRLYFKDFAKIPAAPPPVADQRRFATALRTSDQAILQTQELIRAKQRLRDHLVHGLVTGQLRLSHFGDPIRSRSMPFGWKRKELIELARILSGGTPRKDNPEFWGGNYPWYTAKDLKSFRLAASQIQITESGATSGSRIVGPGTILILVRGMTLLKDVPIGVTTTQAAFNQDVRAICANDDVDPTFLAYALVGRRNQLIRMVTRSGHGTGRLQKESIAELPILMPQREEQRKIADLLTTADTELALLHQQLSQLCSQKRGLMQMLSRFLHSNDERTSPP